MIIYKITNTVNNKIYIGQTTQNIHKRWQSHTWNCTLTKTNMMISSAMAKYGIEKFIIEEIDTAETIDELNEKEIYYILNLNSLAPNGYNVSHGGKNFSCNSETRKKLSDSHKGYKVKEETKKKLSEINKGKPIDIKVREAASEKLSKCYILYKENIIYVIRNMKKFCLEYNHHPSWMCALTTGKRTIAKGFMCIANLGNLTKEELIAVINNYNNLPSHEKIIFFINYKY